MTRARSRPRPTHRALLTTIAAGAAVVLLLPGCPAKPGPRIPNYEQAGILHVPRPIDCVDLPAVTNRHTPADIIPGVKDCMIRRDYVRAAKLYGLAGLYGRIDVLRVTDPTAHRAVSLVISEQLGSFPQEELDRVQRAIVQLTEDPEALRRMCAEITAIGPPTYYPSYMVKRGIRGAAADDNYTSVNANFNMQGTWTESLRAFMNCS